MRAIAWSASGFAGLALAGCAATPPAEDPVQIKLNDLDARLARIERVVSNQSLLQLSNELDALRSDVRSMHNDIDQLVHNMDISRKQQRDLYADLDQRLKRLEGRNAPAGGEASAAGAPPAEPSGGASNPPVADGSDKANYQAAFALLKDSQYDRAIAAFQQFLQSFPDSALADNAQYWLGEAYYVNKSFPEALSAFQRVVDKYPQSRKLPDALLKIGYCEYELKQWQAAKDALSQVASSYPDAPAGHLAQQRLEKMAAEKH
ncbi:MAG: tol-pal system protein YbgF [Steroidobacteraceae bacterium]